MTEKLKTLKDMEIIRIELLKTPEGKRDRRTLRLREISINNLKQEAIKWIKQLQSDHPYESQDEILTMDQYIKGQIDWIKQFFNITDKDLE